MAMHGANRQFQKVVDMNQSQSYANLAAVNPAVEIGLSNVTSGHTANSRFFCVQKSMANLWVGCVELRKQRQFLVTGRPIRTVPPSLIGLSEADNSTLTRDNAMYNHALATPSVSPSVFKFKDSHNVRVQLTISEPWFCLRDVCDVLSVKVASPERFQLDEKGVTRNVIPTDGGNQEATFINEPNLYRIIFRSNKPEAKEFQNWVFSEVLPAIRKTGSYELKTETPPIDVRDLLLNNLSNPTVAFTDRIKKAIEQKAFSLAYEAYELCKEHLEKKVAFNCESGNPRTLNEKKALAIVKDGDLGSALAHTFYTKLKYIERNSYMVMTLTTEYHAKVSDALLGGSQKKLMN